MGNKNVKYIKSAEDANSFKQHMLNDFSALELMLKERIIEEGVQKVGAEQEINFLDNSWRPSLIALPILERLNDKAFTSEYCQFNLEFNLPPLSFKGNFLSSMKSQIQENLHKVIEAAKEFDSEVILTGILPTVLRSDASVDVITPEPRFRALFELMQKYRGKAYEYHIKGIDDLIMRDNLAVFGGCMTSFQLHFQISPNESVEKFNWAQMISGPVLAAATNSPLFLGKRLWHETRIALFQQATDVRKPYLNFKEKEARVSFGNEWVKDSILEIFQDEIVNYKVLLATDLDEDSLAIVKSGGVPELKALNFHNGTIYKWNRPCYGVANGKAHLRIENRILPAGPTMEDQIANAALWFGLMNGQTEKYMNLQEKLPFSIVKDNFLKAARMGLEVKFNWLDGELVSAQKLLIEELIPLAENGLKKAGVDNKDIHHYLNIIAERVRKGQTGSSWMLQSFNKLIQEGTVYEALLAITAGTVRRQQQDIPVHQWEDATLEEAGKSKNRFSKIEQVMTTTIYALEEDDPIDLAAHIMEWKSVSHLPVENKEGSLIGLVTKDSLVKYFIKNKDEDSDTRFIKDIMVADPITINPEANLHEAVSLILDKKITCLPVVKKNKIVGIVTEHDFVKVSKHLFEEILKS